MDGMIFIIPNSHYVLEKRLNLLKVLNNRLVEDLQPKSSAVGKVDIKEYNGMVEKLNDKMKSFEKDCKEKHRRLVQTEEKRLNQEMWMSVQVL